LALGINGDRGLGIFFTPNLVAARSGSVGVVAYALTLLALLPVALTYARLGSRFDRDGGPYVGRALRFGERAALLGRLRGVCIGGAQYRRGDRRAR